jgi:hypothetical protein
MDWIVIDGVQPWDGRYEFDLDRQPFTTREWGWIRRTTGYMPLTVEEGLRGADPELFTVWAVIALRRAGRINAEEVTGTYERLLDAPFGAAITFEGGTEADAGPPPGGPGEGSSSNGATSGPGSSTSSETSEPSAGTHGSATSESGRLMSVS